MQTHTLTHTCHGPQCEKSQRTHLLKIPFPQGAVKLSTGCQLRRVRGLRRSARGAASASRTGLESNIYPWGNLPPCFSRPPYPRPKRNHIIINTQRGLKPTNHFTQLLIGLICKHSVFLPDP